MLDNLPICALVSDATGGVAGMNTSDLIAAVLLVVLGIAFGIGVTCLLVVLHFMKKGRLVPRPILRKREFIPRERRAQTPIFNLPSRWLAIRSGNPQLIQAALALNNPTPCSWEEGVSAAHEHKLFR